MLVYNVDMENNPSFAYITTYVHVDAADSSDEVSVDFVSIVPVSSQNK